MGEDRRPTPARKAHSDYSQQVAAFGPQLVPGDLSYIEPAMEPNQRARAHSIVQLSLGASASQQLVAGEDQITSIGERDSLTHLAILTRRDVLDAVVHSIQQPCNLCRASCRSLGQPRIRRRPPVLPSTRVLNALIRRGVDA